MPYVRGRLPDWTLNWSVSVTPSAFSFSRWAQSVSQRGELTPCEQLYVKGDETPALERGYLLSPESVGPDPLEKVAEARDQCVLLDAGNAQVAVPQMQGLPAHLRH